MYADTLLALERAHLLRLLAWGAASVLLGTLLLALLAARRADTPLLKQFAIQTAAWGAVDLAVVAWAWRGLHLRDYDGAVSLVRALQLWMAAEAGLAAAGVAVAVVGWSLRRRLDPVGAGLGAAVQAVALLVLDGMLVARISPHV